MAKLIFELGIKLTAENAINCVCSLQPYQETMSQQLVVSGP